MATNKDFRVKNGLVVEQDASVLGNLIITGTITGNGSGLTGVTSYTATNFNTDLATKTTDNLGEGSTNLYFTTARSRAAISAGTGVTISNGSIAIGQAVATTDNVSFNNATLAGELRGPATFVIDPAAVGDNTGVVVIKGDLQVDGTTTTINSTTLTIDDKNIVLSSGAANAAAADGAGITIDGASATITYTANGDYIGINKAVRVNDGTNTISIGQWDGVTNRIESVGRGLFLTTYDGTLQLGIDGSADVTLTADRKVGIGTDSPASTLDVKVTRTSSTSATVLTLSDNVTGGQTNGVYKAIRSASNGGNSVSEIRFLETDGTNNNTSIAFATQGVAGGLAERMRVNQSGNVIIGNTTSPSDVLTVINTNTRALGLYRGLDFNVVSSMGTNITFGGLVGSNRVDSAQINAVLDTANSGYLAFNTSTTAGAMTEKFRITASGDIRVASTTKIADQNGAIYATAGATTGGFRLHINSGITASGNYMNFYTSQTAGWAFNNNGTGADANTGLIVNPNGSIVVYGSNGARPTRIDASEITLQGENGGWGLNYGFRNNVGTHVGAFGAFGANGTLSYLYAGTTSDAFMRFSSTENVSSRKLRLTSAGRLETVISAPLDYRGVWDGSLNGYLLLAKAYTAANFPNELSEVSGVFHLSRGSTGSGLRTESIRVSSKRAYNSERFLVNWEGAKDFTEGGGGALRKVTYNGVVYHAIRLQQSGGGPDQHFSFTGHVFDAPLIVALDSEVSNVTEYGTVGTVQLGNGYTGMGRLDPGFKLDIYSEDYAQLRISAPTSPLLKWSGSYNSGNGFEIWQNSDGLVRMNVNGNQSGILLDASGNVSIGSSALPTARLSVAGSGTANNPVLSLDTSSSSAFIHIQESFAGSMTQNQAVINVLGREGSTKNSGYIGYIYDSAGSNTNVLTLGHWGSDHLVRLNGIGNLAIGNSNKLSTARFSVTGDQQYGTIIEHNRSQVAADWTGYNTLFLRNIAGDGSPVSIGFTSINSGGRDHHRAAIQARQRDSISEAYGALGFYVRGTDSGAERLTIDFNGQVGINNTTPEVEGLHILRPTGGSGILSLAAKSSGGGGASVIMMGNNDSGGTAGPNTITAANRVLAIGVGTSFAGTGGTITPILSVGQSNANAASGGVGINIAAGSSPTAALYVNANSSVNYSSDAIAYIAGGNNDWGLIVDKGAADYGIQINVGSTGAYAFRISGSGSDKVRMNGAGDIIIAGTLTESSTRKIKENIRPIVGALEKVKKLQGVIYDRIDGTSYNEPGLIAEDTADAINELVVYDDEGNALGVKYTKTVAYLVEAIKDLSAQFEQFKASK